jgi:hypothetical protein
MKFIESCNSCSQDNNNCKKEHTSSPHDDESKDDGPGILAIALGSVGAVAVVLISFFAFRY